MATTQIISDPFSTEHLHADLKGRSVRGGFWTLISQGAQFVLASVSTIALARLLTPADFGIVAMVTAVTSLGQAFADLGLSEATIQRAEITHEQVSTLFWVNVAIGLGLTLITMMLAPVLAWFYREPRLFDIALVMSLTFLIGGLRVQHTALLKRQMRFSSVGDPRCNFVGRRCSGWHPLGPSRGGLLGDCCHATRHESYASDAFLATGAVAAELTQEGCQSSFVDLIWWECSGVLFHYQHGP